jgi:carnitine monooxygenase subunit
MNSVSNSWLKEEWQSMLRRLVSHIETRSADLSDKPIEIPASSYTDPMRFEAEKKVFLNTPMLAGLSLEIPKPGDRLLFDAAGPPIILVRSEDTSLKAFLNICTHRGARLANNCENSDSFVCPFHAWRFDLNGKLLRRPRADGFEMDNERSRDLIEIPVSEQYGMIFVRPTPGAEAIDINEFLGEMSPLIQALELEHAELVKSDRIDLETNWKLALDTFCEPYHVPALHPKTLAPQLVPLVSIQDSYGKHGRYAGPARYVKEFVGKSEDQWQNSNYSAVHYIFPNCTFTYADAIDGQTPVFAMFRLFPGTEPGKAIALSTTYKPKAAAHADNSGFEALHDNVMNIVKTEDFIIAADSWKSLQHAPKNMKLVFGRNELLLHIAHREIAQAAGMPFK